MGGLAIQYDKIPETKRKSPLLTQRTKSSQLIKTPSDRILFLQRTIGNQAVQGYIRSGLLQAPGNRYGAEGKKIVNIAMLKPGLQLKGNPEEKKEAESTKKEEEKTIVLEGATVIRLPDISTDDTRLTNRAEVEYKIKKPDFKWTETKDGKITEFRKTNVEIQLQPKYGPGTSPDSPSKYGRGTTKADIEAGKTTLGDHENFHVQDAIQYLKDHPLPGFKGKKGMTVTEFKSKIKEYDQEINKYKEQMENHLIKIGDCVGKIDPRVCSE